MSKIALLLFILVLLDIVFGQHPHPATNYQASDHFRQEFIDEHGDIKGQYSYIDPDGKTVTVRYTAGKNGFQVENDQSSNVRTHIEPPTPIHESQYEPLIVQHTRQFAHPQHQRLAIKSKVPQVQLVQNQQEYQPQFSTHVQPQIQVQLQPQARSYQSAVHIRQTVQPQAPLQYQAPPVTKNLFTPLQYEEPVSAPGQIKNYRDALDEYEKDRQSEEQKSFGTNSQYEETLPSANSADYVLNSRAQVVDGSVPQSSSYSVAVPTSTQNHYQGPLPVQVNSAYNFELSY